MSMRLEILLPDSVVASTRVESVNAADESGRFGVLANHEPMVTLLAPCVIWFREESGRERFAAADGGVLLKDGDRVSIVTREAIVADRLEEVARAAAEMIAARRGREAAARERFADLETALLREVKRLQEQRS